VAGAIRRRAASGLLPHLIGDGHMDDHVYKIIELAGTSTDSIEGAIQNAIARASDSLHHLRWFQVMETRGHIEGGKVAHYQVIIKVGFTIEAS
jgi:hypothetical protein